jgi:hypothetical protein
MKIMKSTLVKKTSLEPHLKVVKNSSRSKKASVKLLINTLMPNFKYTNSKGDLISPTNSVLL